MALQPKQRTRVNSHIEDAIKDVKTEKVVKLIVNIPKSLHVKFKVAAINGNTNMSKLVLEWINGYISKD